MTSDGDAGNGVASQRIADALRAAILDGAYLPGERIRQEDLAARSGASRIPAREALRMLAAEGLVTLVANAGAWVTRLTLDQVAEAYQIRERLEPLLLRASIERLDEAAVGRLGELAAQMEAATIGTDPVAGVDAFLRADREFHLASYAAAAGGEAWQIIGRMWNTTQHYRREFTRLAAASGGGPGAPAGSHLTAPGGGLSVTHLEHRLLLDAIRRRDGDDAERALVTHIRRTRLELERHPEIFARNRIMRPNR
jgi:DNA-binding GntR family transcriptional regulator